MTSRRSPRPLAETALRLAEYVWRVNGPVRVADAAAALDVGESVITSAMRICKAKKWVRTRMGSAAVVGYWPGDLKPGEEPPPEPEPEIPPGRCRSGDKCDRPAVAGKMRVDYGRGKRPMFCEEHAARLNAVRVATFGTAAQKAALRGEDVQAAEIEMAGKSKSPPIYRSNVSLDEVVAYLHENGPTGATAIGEALRIPATKMKQLAEQGFEAGTLHLDRLNNSRVLSLESRAQRKERERREALAVDVEKVLARVREAGGQTTIGGLAEVFGGRHPKTIREAVNAGEKSGRLEVRRSDSGRILSVRLAEGQAAA